MKTIEIINSSSKFYIDSVGSEYIGFESFKNVWKVLETSNLDGVDDKLSSFFPLREPVLKLIYKDIFGTMPFCKEYVLTHYQSEYEGLKYLHFPCNGITKRLVVLYSGFSPRPTYNRFSWYWDESQTWEGDTVYLFLNDTDGSWYCGFEKDKMDNYLELIKIIMNKYSLSNQEVFTIGGSMGGYGALLHGLKMNVKGIIAINPQVDALSASHHNDKTWTNNIKKAGENFKDIAGLLSESNSSVYIEAGCYLADRNAIKSLSQSVTDRNGITLLNLHSAEKHNTSSPDKEQISILISLFENNKVSNLFSESLILAN